MWCPEGYYSWSQVLGAFDEVANSTLSFVCNERATEVKISGVTKSIPNALFALVDSGYADDYSEASLLLGITSLFLVAQFLDQHPPILAGLDGNKIRPHWSLLTHRDQLELCDYRWPLKSHPSFLHFFRYRKESGFDSRALGERFAFIDPATGTIGRKNGSRAHLTNNLGFEPAAADRIERLAEKLQDYVLCWPSVPTAEEYRGFLTCIEHNEIFKKALDHNYGASSESVQTQRRGPGRPRKRDELAEVYFSIFPAGHDAEGKNWKEAIRSVEQVLGRRVNQDTLKRGIEDAETKSQNG